jgi:hypothetical protein
MNRDSVNGADFFRRRRFSQNLIHANFPPLKKIGGKNSCRDYKNNRKTLILPDMGGGAGF